MLYATLAHVRRPNTGRLNSGVSGHGKLNVISNLETHLSIALDAHSEMVSLMAKGRRPKPDGSPGFVITLDPDRKCFKKALITSAFAGIYFEALTYATARHISKTKAVKVDKAKYREKLEELGVTDVALLEAAEKFRKDRNDVIHEKALPASEFSWSEGRFAQDCADSAIEFIMSVRLELTGAR